MSDWPSPRRNLAISAVLVALFIGVSGTWVGGPGLPSVLAVLYVTAALLALLFPAAIAVQVILGQALAGVLVVGPDPPFFPSLVLLVAGVILNAEVLAVVARMDTSMDSDPRDDLPRAGKAALIGGCVFGFALVLSRIPGPTGLMAVLLASLAVVGLAALMAGIELPRDPPQSPPNPPSAPDHNSSAAGGVHATVELSRKVRGPSVDLDGGDLV